MTEADKATAEQELSQQREVDIIVNTKPVRMPSREATGLQIKEAAISQGVASVRLDAALYIVQGSNFKPIGDPEQVKLHENEEFRAIAPDDNSENSR